MGDRKREYDGPKKTQALIYARDLPRFTAEEQVAVCLKHAKATGLTLAGSHYTDKPGETRGLVAACAGMILLQEDAFVIATEEVLGRSSWARRYVESALRDAAAEFGARLVIVDHESGGT